MLQMLLGTVDTIVSKTWHGFYIHGACILNWKSANKAIGQMVKISQCTYCTKKKYTKSLH